MEGLSNTILKGQLYIFFLLLNEVLANENEPHFGYGFTDFSNEDIYLDLCIQTR